MPRYPHLDHMYEWGNWSRDVRREDLVHASVQHIAREEKDSLTGLSIERD
ncbi:MAG: hypothetical protein AAF530_00010 [Pseudomonadota bacterium]